MWGIGTTLKLVHPFDRKGFAFFELESDQRQFEGRGPLAHAHESEVALVDVVYNNDLILTIRSYINEMRRRIQNLLDEPVFNPA